MSAEMALRLDPVVYVAVDRYDRALYIGATQNLARRLREHRGKNWWHLVGAVEVYPQADWPLALFVERNMIRQLNPEFNVQSTDREVRVKNHIWGSLVRWIGGFGE